MVEATGRPARVFRDFLWSTKESWSRRRRVIAKAEWTRDEANPRFLVTSLKPDRWAARALYEDLYCARGEMENRIKECQGDLFADRTSAATMRANQLRLWQRPPPSTPGDLPHDPDPPRTAPSGAARHHTVVKKT